MEHTHTPAAPTPRPPGMGVRHRQALITFLCMVFMYSMRVNLSVGIVAMTDNKGSNPNFPVMPWENYQQGIILSSFFWGYALTGIPAGHLSRRLGPRYPLFVALLVCSLLTILSPYIAQHFSWLVFCCSRVVQGLAQGFLYPSINTHMSKWAPPLERSRMFSFVFGGPILGTVVTMFVAGYLAASAGGWPSIFYCTGLVSTLWAMVWVVVGADSPDEHSTISEEERDFINSSLTATSADSKMMETPWRHILRSVPVWALVTVHMAQNWGFFTLLTMLPSYMSHVLGFDIKSNGVVSALPYAAMWVVMMIFSWIADFINEREIVSLNFARKMWNTLAHWGAAGALVALPLVSASVSGTVALLTVSVAINAGINMGYLTNHLDLSPNFAGLLMGMTNGLANVFSIMGPTVTGFIVTDVGSAEQWMVAFYLSAVIFFVGNLVFIVFGSTEVQPWNTPQPSSHSDTERGLKSLICH